MAILYWFLCRFGCHDWEYGYQKIHLTDGSIHIGYQVRLCRRCPAKQTYLGHDDKGRDRLQWIRSNRNEREATA